MRDVYRWFAKAYGGTLKLFHPVLVSKLSEFDANKYTIDGSRFAQRAVDKFIIMTFQCKTLPKLL